MLKHFTPETILVHQKRFSCKRNESFIVALRRRLIRRGSSDATLPPDPAPPRARCNTNAGSSIPRSAPVVLSPGKATVWPPVFPTVLGVHLAPAVLPATAPQSKTPGGPSVGIGELFLIRNRRFVHHGNNLSKGHRPNRPASSAGNRPPSAFVHNGVVSRTHGRTVFRSRFPLIEGSFRASPSARRLASRLRFRERNSWAI